MSSLPSPLVPADVDLTDFKFMPLEHARLRRSRAWLICKRRPELGFWQINLWTGSWSERPASSLEDDDDVLADVAMCPPDRWPEVKADVLRGWIKCSDGRLYHPVVAEKALEAWNSKLEKRWHNECDRLRKENYRREKEGLEALPLPAKPAKISAGSHDVSAGCPPDVQAGAAGIPAENALKGRDREGKGESTAGDVPPEDGEIRQAFDGWNEAAARNPRWPTAQTIGPVRRRALLARLRDVDGLPGFLAVLSKAESSSFIRNDMTGWSLDWFLKPANFTKVREGNYDRSRGVPPAETGVKQPMQI
jgi:uncharacterized protein DUF1376